MKQSQYIPDGWGFDKWVRPASSHKSPKRTKFFVCLVIASLFLLGLSGCKAPKDVSSHSKEKGKTKKANDLQIDFDTRIDEAVSNALEKALRKKLNIQVQQTIYDTDKPIDQNTGKPPIKEENTLSLSEETEAQTKEQTNIEASETSSAQVQDKGKEHSTVDNEQTKDEKTVLNWWQKIVSGIIVFGIAVWLIIWGSKRLLKWKLKL